MSKNLKHVKMNEKTHTACMLATKQLRATKRKRGVLTISELVWELLEKQFPDITAKAEAIEAVKNQ